MSYSTTRRSLLAASAGALSLALTGCGQGVGRKGGEGERTVRGALGTIRVPQDPRRVVSVGQYRDTDAAVALGVVPLLSPDLSTFIEGGVAPWVRQELKGRRLDLADVAQMPYEKIAGLRPDLILATDRLKLEDEYAKLSKIAPTLSWQNGYNRDDWRTTTMRVGRALGRESRARDVVATTESAVAQARSNAGELAGKTFTIGPVQENGDVTTINSARDASAVFLSQLGMELSPQVQSLPSTDIPGRAAVSAERLDLLDADVLMLTYNTAGARERMEASPLFRSIPAVRRGAYVALDLPTALAIAFPSALSVRYGLTVLVPAIQKALA